MISILGENYTIIEDGLNGRTVLNLSPVNKMANGIECTNSVIETSLPLDIVIISLGLNDVFIGGEVTLQQISDGVEEIIDIIRNSHISGGFKIPEFIIMAPPEFNTGIEGVQFFELQINKLKGLPEIYKHLSSKNNYHFFNTSDYVKGSILDGSHLEPGSHVLLGEKMAEFILSRIK